MSETITKSFEFLANGAGDVDLLILQFDESVVLPCIDLKQSAKTEVVEVSADVFYIRLVISADKPNIGKCLKLLKSFRKIYVEDDDVPFSEEDIKKSFEDPDPNDKNAWKNRVVIPKDAFDDKTQFRIVEVT